MFKSFICFFSLLLVLNTTQAQDRSKWTQIDYWQATQISFEATLFGDINTQTCLNHGKEYFVGCIYAVANGISLGKNDGHFYTITPNPKAVAGLAIKPIDTKRLDFKELMDDYINSLRDWYSVYSQTPMAQTLDITSFYLGYKSIYINASNESYNTALIYNDFLRYAYDPHTYIVPQQMNEDRVQSSAIPRGIYGFEYRKVQFRGEEKFIVDYVYRNSSAEKGNLKAGDVLLSINGKSDLKELLAEMNASSEITLEVINASGQRTLKMKRMGINIDTVDIKVEKSLNGKLIGFISLSTFMDERACEKIKAYGAEMIKRNVDGIVLDLRHNGGGYVHVATCINQEFLEKESLLFVQQDLGTKKFSSRVNEARSGVFRKIHSVVLINGGSASASEVVSTYLQSYRKAFIVGENSFGKGTMQSVGNFGDSVLKAETTAKYYGPNGVSPQLQGIIPDFKAGLIYGQPEATYQRERDLYDNAIANEKVAVPTMPEREKQLGVIQECLEKGEVALRSYEKKNEFQQLIHDNQEAVAMGVLDCAFKHKIPVYMKTKIASKFDL